MVDDYGNQDERETLGRKHVVEPYGLVFVTEAKRKLEDVRPIKRQQNTGRRMYATRIAEHIEDNPQQETSAEQTVFVAIHRIQNNEQHVRIRVNVPQKPHIVKNKDLCRKQQNETGNIDQQSAIHGLSFPG